MPVVPINRRGDGEKAFIASRINLEAVAYNPLGHPNRRKLCPHSAHENPSDLTVKL
jgi:hypothetical protein